MSIQLQSMSIVLSVSPEKTELLTAIKNEPLESEIGIDDIPNSLDEEIIPDIKDIDIVSHELSEDLIKSETVSKSTFENNHSGSVETQVFVKTENISLIKTENITQSEYLYKTQDISDGNVSRGTSQGVIEVQGSNEYFNALQSDKQFVNLFKDLSDISRKAKCPNKTAFSECYKTGETTSCERDRRKGKVIEVPVVPIEPHRYTFLAKQNKKSYCCEKCTFTSENHSYFKRHKLSHKTKAEVDSRYLKYHCDKSKYKTYCSNSFKIHKLKHLKPEQIPYFYCYHCSYKCKRKDSLKTHIFIHFKNEEVSFHCYICEFTTLKRNLIIKHFKKHPKHHSKCDETDYKNQFETYTKYCCDKCQYTTCWSSHFKIHKLKHLKPEEIPYFCCYHCPYKCKVKGSLKIHIFNHFKKQEVPFHCYICDFTTVKRNLIIKHFKKHPKHHSKCDETDYKNQFETYTKYRCDKCKYKSYWSGHLKTHKLMHLNPEQIPYIYCYHCSYKCKVKSNLKIHIFNHFKKQEVPFHCYICDFTTLKRNLIIEHFKKHSKHHSKCDKTDYETYIKKQMRYCCEKCTYTSGKSSAFKLHQPTHKAKAETDDRFLKYRCDKCEYKTCWSTTFKAHKLTHLKPEEIHYFHCYHCSYKSKQKINLQTHIVRHFKNKDVPFHCYICDFVTLKRDLIIKHFKTHPKHHSKFDETDYKNQLETYTKYRCDKCEYKSCWLSSFKTHKLKHLKPEQIPYFYCYHCPYKCKLKGNLKNHIFNHLKKEEVPFHCYICDFTTLKRDLLIEHFKTHPKHHSKYDETEYKNQLEIPYFYCYHCPYKCKQKGNLKIHIFNHFKYEEVSFHCYICDFTTLKRNLIIEHFKKHSKQHSKCDKTDYETYTKKQMKLRYCGEKCTNTSGKSSNFKLHQVTYKTKAEIDDRLYRCDKCKYETYWCTNLKKHKLIHLKPEEVHYFHCYHCSYKCKQKVNLQSHIFCHFKNENVLFHCYLCDFVTLKRDLIIKHFKTHPKHHSKCDETDYKNQLEIYTKYRCDKCKYKSWLLSSFKTHKLMHLKPEQISYVYCYHCSYKTKRKQNIKKHIFRHFKKEEITFHCYICDFMTLQRDLIIEHFKKHSKHHSMSHK